MGLFEIGAPKKPIQASALSAKIVESLWQLLEIVSYYDIGNLALFEGQQDSFRYYSTLKYHLLLGLPKTFMEKTDVAIKKAIYAVISFSLPIDG